MTPTEQKQAIINTISVIAESTDNLSNDKSLCMVTAGISCNHISCTECLFSRDTLTAFANELSTKQVVNLNNKRGGYDE